MKARLFEFADAVVDGNAFFVNDTKVLTYSLSGKPATLSAKKVDVSTEGTKLSFLPSPTAEALGCELNLRAVGDVHGANAMAAALGAIAMGYEPHSIVQGLAQFTTLPGRFDIVSTKPLVVVDYAHTPDGIKGTLNTARSLCRGRLLCVFGCGGERDQGKRPHMGEVVDELADIVVLTSDNPRREDPLQIAKQVMMGVQQQRARWIVEHDRRKAIAWTLQEAMKDDVVVIAGKGHEQEQTIGTKNYPFCDRAVVKKIISFGS